LSKRSQDQRAADLSHSSGEAKADAGAESTLRLDAAVVATQSRALIELPL
jgi:hypothetical protein